MKFVGISIILILISLVLFLARSDPVYAANLGSTYRLSVGERLFDISYSINNALVDNINNDNTVRTYGKRVSIKFSDNKTKSFY